MLEAAVVGKSLKRKHSGEGASTDSDPQENTTKVELVDSNSSAPEISNLHKILQSIEHDQTEATIALINLCTVEELNQIIADKNTTVLCAAVLAKNAAIVKCLLDKKVEVNTNFKIVVLHETILSRLFAAENFDEKSVVIAKMLVQGGTKFYTKDEQSVLLDAMEICFSYGDDITLQKINLYIDIMGNEFYAHLLHHNKAQQYLLFRLMSKNIVANDADRQALQEFICKNLMAYLQAVPSISDQQLRLVWLACYKQPALEDFCKSKCSDASKTPKTGEGAQKFARSLRETQLIDTRYHFHRDSFATDGLVPFTEERERAAFTNCINELLKAPLSYEIYEATHKLALKSNESSDLCKYSTFAGLDVLNSAMSLKGLFELRELEKTRQWFSLGIRHEAKMHSFVMNPKLTAEDAKAEFQKEISVYNAEIIKIATRKEKLQRIIRLGSDLTRMHTFEDGNKRASVIAFNCELIRHDFLPVKDFNRAALRGHSQEELFDMVLESMQQYYLSNQWKIDESIKTPVPLSSSPVTVSSQGTVPEQNESIACSKADTKAVIRLTMN